MAVENRGPELQAVACTLLAMAIFSKSLRVYVRVFLVKSFGIDDWFMVGATIFFTLFVTCALVGIHYGTGRHHRDLEEADRVEALKYWWFCYLWYCLSMICSKISIGYFLLRITVKKLHTWIIYGAMAITVMTGVVFFFVTIFQCNPVSFFWNKDQSGTCVPVEVIIALTFLYSVFSVISDFTFAILPAFLISGLNMDRRTKTVLIPLFAMACAASAAVAVRFAYINDFKDPDFLWATVDIAIWSTVEQGLAITAASLATLRPLYRIVLSKLGLSSGGGSGLPLSGNKTPSRRGFSNLGSSKQSRGLGGNFSLKTFINNDEEPKGGGRAAEASQQPASESDTKTPSTWRIGTGDSEEELTERSKGGIWRGQQYEVTISSGQRAD